METTTISPATGIAAMVNRQKAYFRTGVTRDVDFRIKQLKKLYALMEENEARLLEALNKDLGKPAYEALSIEAGPVYAEISFLTSHVRKWAQPEVVTTSLYHTPGNSKILHEPYGNVLIIAPWNYPYLLSINPLAGAMSAGNCVLLKPSEHAPYTAAVMADIINSNFDPGYIHVVQGAVEETQALLAEKWDYIFFTGGTEIGRIIYQAAAKNLTPVTLELGGKSPCVVHKDASLKLAAKRIAWGKFISSGQTCLAPDYVFVHRSVKDKFLQELRDWLEKSYGKEPLQSPDLGKIINRRQYDRLKAYLNDGDVFCGGQYDNERLKITPTILLNAPFDSPVMKDEIFGPILPVYDYEDMDEVVKFIGEREKPLGAYIFSTSAKVRQQFIDAVPSGGVTENDTVLHISSSYMPFGGIGSSGLGGYHGKFSFDTFSHKRSVLHRMPHMLDPFLRYPPYSQKKMGLMRFLLKKFL